MAGGIATGIDLSKSLRGVIGFAAAGLTDVALSKGGSDAVDITSVEKTLRNSVGAAGNYVASILTNVTGRGNLTTLPIYTYTTPSMALPDSLPKTLSFSMKTRTTLLSLQVTRLLQIASYVYPILLEKLSLTLQLRRKNLLMLP